LSTTFTIRIPRKLKEKMEQNPSKWSQEVREFLEERIKQIEIANMLEEIESRSKKRRTNVDSATLVREDRER